MTRTDSTKKRARKIVLILLVLLVALVIGFLVVYSRMDQLGMVPVLSLRHISAPTRP